ncbi:MAG: DMT family transporter [Anaerolineae bacterium]|nr:DMT family transporter [Anaerolineae bacterium]
MTANLLLLLAAAVWGFAFVAQRVGMAHMGPFTFNAIRFALGALSLIPVMGATRSRQEHNAPLGRVVLSGSVLGVVLFAAASAQQLGIMTTTAGKAGFITGLYVVLVPLLALVWGERASWLTWVGALLAAGGLYFLSGTEQVGLSTGDAWILLGAFLFAIQIQLLAYLTQRVDPLPLAAVQFVVCSLLSWLVAWSTEPITWSRLEGGLVALLYGGFMSVGVAYTLQAVAQRHARPTPAAIIMSFESPFAALGGWLLLGERLGARGGIGAALMMAGMLLTQVKSKEAAVPTPDPPDSANPPTLKTVPQVAEGAE